MSDAIRKRADRLFTILMIAAWFAAVLLVLVQPSTTGALATVLLGGALIASYVRGNRATRETHALTEQLQQRVEERTAALADAQRQLVVTERLTSVGTLAAGVAHEINNPLAFILGNVDYAVRELRSPRPEIAEVVTALEEAKVGGNRVRDIVRDLKLFARAPEVETGVAMVEPMLERAIAVASNEIRHRARIVLDFEGVPPVTGAESRLGQVFLNLLINAAQAIPEGKADLNEIRVATCLREGHVEISISDTGEGIPPHVRDRIFEPFFTTKAIGTGTGLGLSICHGIVNSIGGEISVTSQIGKGSCFTVRLRASTVDGVVREPQNVPAAEGSASHSILVIDDEPMLARSLRRVLKPHRVSAETSGRGALQRLTMGERFDLVLCDLMMPEMTGPEVYREICRLAPDQAERVVFVTGGAFTSAASEFLAGTARTVLDKPADASEIRRILDALPRTLTAPRPCKVA